MVSRVVSVMLHWVSVTKLRNHQKKAAVKLLSRMQDKYILGLEQQMWWSGARLREGE